jgi:hypothetical protein
MNLNAAHIHLILNHIPVLGTLIFAPLVLIWGLVRRSRDVTITGLLLAVILALTTIPIYLTGEPAEHELENQPWLEKPRVETHEEQAEAGLIAVLVTGAIALVALWMSRGGRPARGVLTGIVVVGLLVSAVLFSIAALSGGQIRHDEIRSPPAAGAAVGPVSGGVRESA